MFTVMDLWKELRKIPVDDNGDIQEQFLNFSVGTDREDIWHWFEDTFDIPVACLAGIAENGTDGWWRFDVDGVSYIIYSWASKMYFHTPGCECRPVFVKEAAKILVGGSDDCPVHGFGRKDA